jgi:hypothetical protein
MSSKDSCHQGALIDHRVVRSLLESIVSVAIPSIRNSNKTTTQQQIEKIFPTAVPTESTSGCCDGKGGGGQVSREIDVTR